MQDLNDLFYFAKVVEAGGFAAAGRALGIPKSRLSRRIAELENRLGARLLSMARQLRRWWQLAEQRRRLGMLDDAALKDIGLSRADALQESERPFWDDPLKR